MNYDNKSKKNATSQQVYGGSEFLDKFTNEFARRCCLCNAQLQDSQINGLTRDDYEIERQVAEDLSVELDVLYSHSQLYEMWSIGPAGDENETFYDGCYVYKMNNLWHCHTVENFFEKIRCHNNVFPETRYELFGFCGERGRSMYPIVRQVMIQNASPATMEEIDNHMLSLGYERVSDGRYRIDDKIIVWDLFPKNVLRSPAGNIYVIDAEFTLSSDATS